MRNKKAAIELSVTAIIILILAIVMLGLGLGFIRGMFSKVSTTFDEQISAEPEPTQASGSEPITLSRQTIIANSKDDVVLKANLYNPTNTDWNDVFMNATCNNLKFNVQANTKDIAQGDSTSFNLLFTIPASANQGAYLCQAFINNFTSPSTPNPLVILYSKDFTITVS